MPRAVEMQHSSSPSTEKIFLDSPLYCLRASKNDNRHLSEFQEHKSCLQKKKNLSLRLTNPRSGSCVYDSIGLRQTVPGSQVVFIRARNWMLERENERSKKPIYYFLLSHSSVYFALFSRSKNFKQAIIQWSFGTVFLQSSFCQRHIAWSVWLADLEIQNSTKAQISKDYRNIAGGASQ